jgi:hypothetical protein
MPAFQPISRERHAGKRWKRFVNFSFAAKEAVAPLAAAELPRIAVAMPIAFVEMAGHKQAVAVLSLVPGRNLFVAPDGRWIGPYIPALFRAFPFVLAKGPEGQQVLCIAEDSGMLTDGPEGEAFFGEDGKPAAAVADILKFLHQFERSRILAQQATACLEKHGLLQAWPVTLKTPDGEQQIPGLFRVDEAALNALGAEALVELRQTGALSLAYCHLLSVQHLPLLGKLADAQIKAMQKLAEQQAKQAALVQGRDLDLEFMNGETINFSGLG